MVSGYGRGTANRRNTLRNISKQSPSTNMGNYPAVELWCNATVKSDNITVKRVTLP